MNPLFFDSMKFLAKKGITTSLLYSSEEDQFYIDLNTGAKSHLYLYEDGTLVGRYKKFGKLDWNQHDLESVVYDLCYQFTQSLCGRSYYNGEWKNLCDSLEFTIPKGYI